MALLLRAESLAEAIGELPADVPLPTDCLERAMAEREVDRAAQLQRLLRQHELLFDEQDQREAAQHFAQCTSRLEQLGAQTPLHASVECAASFAGSVNARLALLRDAWYTVVPYELRAYFSAKQWGLVGQAAQMLHLATADVAARSQAAREEEQR
jgi:hypothetical protein